MELTLTKEERSELNRLCDTALRALPTMIKAQPNPMIKDDMRAHRNAIMQIKLKIKE